MDISQTKSSRTLWFIVFTEYFYKISEVSSSYTKILKLFLKFLNVGIDPLTIFVHYDGI